MSSLVELMDEMAETLRTAFAASDVAIQVEPRMILNPSPPSIDIYPGDPSRESGAAAMGDIDGGLLFTVRARVHTADQEAGQDLLLAFMDDEDDLSVAAALVEDRTLNGLASFIDIGDQTGYVLFADPGNEGALLGCTWAVTIYNTPS